MKCDQKAKKVTYFTVTNLTAITEAIVATFFFLLETAIMDRTLAVLLVLLIKNQILKLQFLKP